jgi:hypothetical protein
MIPIPILVDVYICGRLRGNRATMLYPIRSQLTAGNRTVDIYFRMKDQRITLKLILN